MGSGGHREPARARVPGPEFVRALLDCRHRHLCAAAGGRARSDAAGRGRQLPRHQAERGVSGRDDLRAARHVRHLHHPRVRARIGGQHGAVVSTPGRSRRGVVGLPGHADRAVFHDRVRVGGQGIGGSARRLQPAQLHHRDLLGADRRLPLLRDHRRGRDLRISVAGDRLGPRPDRGCVRTSIWLAFDRTADPVRSISVVVEDFQRQLRRRHTHDLRARPPQRRSSIARARPSGLRYAVGCDCAAGGAHDDLRDVRRCDPGPDQRSRIADRRHRMVVGVRRLRPPAAPGQGGRIGGDGVDRRDRQHCDHPDENSARRSWQLHAHGMDRLRRVERIRPRLLAHAAGGEQDSAAVAIMFVDWMNPGLAPD